MWLEQKRLGKLLHEHNLTMPQFFVLVHLAHRENGCAIGDLAGKLFQSNATMTGIVDRLEEERLVHRARNDAEDRRKVMVQVTPRGRHLLGKATESRRAQSQRVLAQFSTPQLEELHLLLTEYATHLEKES
jgi:DNA-binding MarR family transcriptional regulator